MTAGHNPKTMPTVTEPKNPNAAAHSGIFIVRAGASVVTSHDINHPKSNPANPPAPVILKPATRTEPALVAPPQPSDLIRLLSDSEARTRRRAALAVGRVGLAAGVEPLTRLLTDEELEVRQMAAFALGLLVVALKVGLQH